jgi:hypothetical protein
MLSLDDQPNVPRNEQRGYHLRALVSAPQEKHLWEKPLDQWGDNRDQLLQAARDGFEALEKTRAVGDAAGKITFAKEHVCLLTDPNLYSEFIFGDTTGRRWRLDQDGSDGTTEQTSKLNDTMFSETYLRQWKMAFLIRHPALAFPSLYRILMVDEAPDQENMKGRENYLRIFMTLWWSRRLYDLATQIHERGGNDTAEDADNPTWPILLDADDIITNPLVVEKFADIMGMDPTKVQSTWSPTSNEEIQKMRKLAQRMLSTLNASNGVMKEKAKANIDITAEAKQWREEFGEEGGQNLEKWVRAAMPDYEYLREKRLRV